MNKTLRNLALVALAAAPFSVYAEVAGSGTAEDPYQIKTADDIEEMHNLVKAGEMTYFVQVADIDMAGIEKHIAPVGSDGSTYNMPINYDGRNHKIMNFAPKNDVFAAPDCYAQSVFGVFSGELKNLGIVDINISAAGGRGGAISGYLGQSTAGVEVTKVSNVYVTGTIYAGSSYMGGLFGTTGTDVELNNCYVNVNVDAAEGALVGGIAGRLNNPATINNCYVAGTATGAAKLVCAANTKPTTINGLVIFATGADDATGLVANVGDPLMANTADTKADGIAEVLSWGTFQAGQDLPVLKYALSGAGTEADPYQIASVQDLCNAYTVVNGKGCDVYFVQTADIDMEGQEEYHAIAGYDGAYNAIIHYDGQNHIISNFAPACTAPEVSLNNYYCTSIFGVPSGEISNLGVVNAYCSGDKQGMGILGAYAGHGNGSDLKLNNVFVQGEVAYDATGNYTGGMFGTSGNNVTMVSCFANVKVSGGTYTAGLIGRLRNTLSLENVYVAGSVASTVGDAFLVADADKDCEVSAYNVIAFNEGGELLGNKAASIDEDIVVATEADKADLIETVQGWNGFSADKLFEDYPMLDGFNVETSSIFDATVEENVEGNGPAVYYNLQGVQVANPDNGVYIVRRGNKVTKELIRK